MVSGAIALCTWQGQLSRDASGAHWSVGLLVAAAFLLALFSGRGRQRHTSGTWVARSARGIWNWRSQPTSTVVAIVMWSALFAAVVGWDAASFILQSHLLPTLSYFMGRVTRYPVGRGAFFALWLGLGFYLASGWRAPARP